MCDEGWFKLPRQPCISLLMVIDVVAHVAIIIFVLTGSSDRPGQAQGHQSPEGHVSRVR